MHEHFHTSMGLITAQHSLLRKEMLKPGSETFLSTLIARTLPYSLVSLFLVLLQSSRQKYGAGFRLVITAKITAKLKITLSTVMS
jgi:hypothetical protein